MSDDQMITADDAIRLAMETAHEAGWPWFPPVRAQLYSAGLIKPRLLWHVMSNAAHRGGNVNVHIDRATGAVVKKAFAPR